MGLEQTLDASNNTNISTNHNMAGWSTSQKMSNDVHHAARMDKKAELEHSNLIAHQNLANQSALDQLNSSRTMDRLVMGAIANKLLNLEPEDAVATGEILKSSANAGLSSLLSQLNAGGLGVKSVAITPPETGIANALASYNAVSSQGAQQTAASSALANSLVAATQALAGIYQKGLVNTVPVGTSHTAQI